jgi:hypothetical protein
VINFFYRAEVRDIGTGITDNGHHAPQNGPVGPEKINKGYGEYKDEPAQETAEEKQDLGSFDQFLLVFKFISFEKIKHQEDGRYDGVVNAIFQEWIGSG